jgi:predicted secreted hydrolase
MRSLVAIAGLTVLWAPLAACGGPGSPAPDGGACSVVPSGRVSLPADDSAHRDPLEWWYWTGHLQTPGGRWFGFEWAFFRVVQSGITGQMAHHALTDVGGQSFHYRVDLAGTAPAVVPNGFNLSVGGLTAVGGNGRDTLHGTVDGYTLDLELEAQKSPVLQHGTGYTDYSFGGYTYYYSRERMTARGTLGLDGGTEPVTGTAWFDHQWGDLQPAIGKGWDWFALQLDDRREIMLFIVRVNGQQVLVGGSYVDQNCTKSEIGPTEFVVTSLGTWSPRAGCTYPLGWTITVRGMTLTVTPVLQNQEVRSAFVTYWEGAATVSGDATGRAYIELTGYCR